MHGYPAGGCLMNKEKKLQIQKALQDYTKKTTKSASEAKKALLKEGIYLKDGKLAPEYKEPAAA
jgi:hypothetical protein